MNLENLSHSFVQPPELSYTISLIDLCSPLNEFVQSIKKILGQSQILMRMVPRRQTESQKVFRHKMGPVR